MGKLSTRAKVPAAIAPQGGDKDPRVAHLVNGMRGDPKLASAVLEFEEGAATKRGRKFGSNGLKTNGKLFALFTQGTLVVKLPENRVAELVASKVGEPFDPGHGRRMREWLTVVSLRASWIDLAREAYAFVNRGGS